MIGLLITVLILLLVFGVLVYVVRLLPLPEPFGTIALLIIALIFVLMVIGMLVGGLPYYRLP